MLENFEEGKKYEEMVHEELRNEEQLGDKHKEGDNNIIDSMVET